MDFLKAVTTAHSTYTEGAPLITRLRLTLGRLVGGWLYFPTGPSGVLHFKASIGGHQILPSTPDQDYALNDCVVPLHLDYDIDDYPVDMDLITWNDSTAYDHILSVCLFVDPLAAPPRRRTFWDMLRGQGG